MCEVQTQPKVIEGLRLLPWVHWRREKLADSGDPYARHFLDCEWCLPNVDPVQRRALGCGYVDASERLGCIQIDGAPAATVCPGCTTVMPQVLEASRALSWKADGQIREYLDGRELTPCLVDAIDFVSCEVRSVERHALRVIQEEAKRG